jgi:hypothetical protein
MWTVVYIASNLARAESLKEILIAEGLMVTLRPTGFPHSRNGGGGRNPGAGVRSRGST